MSFLTKTTGLPRAVAISATRLPATYTQRPFTSTTIQQKTAAETVKEGIKKVDRAVSDNVAIPALDAAAAARDAVKGGAEKVESGQARAEAEGKAAELKGKAKGAAAEAEGKVKGAAEQAKQKL